MDTGIHVVIGTTEFLIFFAFLRHRLLFGKILS
jgi:hypothetical protein